MTYVLMCAGVCWLALFVPGFRAPAYAPSAAGQKPPQVKMPEAFTANAHVASSTGASAATITIQIDRYTADNDRQVVADALKAGPHEAFLSALRKAPAAGSVIVADKTFTIRWAQQERSATYKRTITLVTDQPMFFVGGGQVDAKPRTGFDVAVLKFEIDDAGLGSGTMAAAATIKLDEKGAVQIEDYAGAPIKLITVTKKFA